MGKETGLPSGMPELRQPTAEEAGRLNALGASADGQKVKALLGDERKLAEAVRTGDTAALKGAMETVLRSEEGRRLLQQLSALMGKP